MRFGFDNLFHQSKEPPTTEEWCQAICDKKLKKVKSLLARGADIDQELSAESEHQHTALYRCALLGHTKMLQLLIDNGADINKKDQYGDTALDAAHVYHETAAIKMLENAAAHLKEKPATEIVLPQPAKETESAPQAKDLLSLAIQSGDCDQVRDLFNQDFCAGRKVSVCWEQLKIAILNDDAPMIRLLITWDARAPDDPTQLEGIEKEKYEHYTKILKRCGLPTPVLSAKEEPVPEAAEADKTTSVKKDLMGTRQRLSAVFNNISAPNRRAGPAPRAPDLYGDDYRERAMPPRHRFWVPHRLGDLR